MIRVHRDWETSAFARPPTADLVGPFPHRPFLETWWRHRGTGEVMIAESESALVAAVLGPEGLELMGEPDLTDYHAPLGAGVAEAVGALVAALPSGTSFRFDSLPLEAAVEVAAGVEQAGVAARPEQHQVAAVLDLPATHQGFLAGLGGKERHEVRRKRRRFEAAYGPARLERRGPHELPLFAAMHRDAPGRKGGFLTEDMESFFSGLLDLEGAVLDVLLGGDGEPRAAAFGFEDGEAYYLYNSAYDLQASSASPGVVLLDLLIGGAIEAGRRRFDFLKGDESYKFRMGARPRRLFVVEGER